MKSRRMIRLLGVLSVLALLGCSQRLIDFTIISSKNLDLSKAAEFTRGSERVEGKDTKYIIIFFPTGIPNMKEAVDRAIEKVPGAVALVDGVLTAVNWYVPFLVGASSYVVEGLPLIDKSLISGEGLRSNYMVSYYDCSRKEQRLVYLTEAEYLSVKNAIQKKDVKSLKEILVEN